MLSYLYGQYFAVYRHSLSCLKNFEMLTGRLATVDCLPASCWVNAAGIGGCGDVCTWHYNMQFSYSCLTMLTVSANCRNL